MTQAEFDEVMADIKARNPNIFQLISDFLDRKVTPEEMDEFFKRGHNMNELDISNTQAAVLIVILIGLLLYLNHRDRKKKRPN